MRKPPGEARPAEVEPRFAPVVEAFADDPDVSAGTMMASFGLKVRGRIFAMVARGRLVVKLPKARVDELVAAGAGERFDPGHGRVMKEWIAMGTDEGWVELAREAHRFVRAGAA
jgi:TfoX/Sxy family transcriptional regulator of competence genes